MTLFVACIYHPGINSDADVKIRKFKSERGLLQCLKVERKNIRNVMIIMWQGGLMNQSLNGLRVKQNLENFYLWLGANGLTYDN